MFKKQNDTSWLMGSDCIPAFWKQLLHSDVKNILVTGAGGGFDFVHSMLLYPTLMKAGKKVVFGSYSFGDPDKIQGGPSNHELNYLPTGHRNERAGTGTVKLVDATCMHDPKYCPEVGLCRFLDEHFSAQQPHHCYAYYARDFTVPMLTALYSTLIEKHKIDAIVCVDGGSDSLMAGDEAGLGDPIEDAVSVTTIAGLNNPRLKVKLLITIGVGCDRFNYVSDGATLRAMAELRARGGFLGSIAMEPTSAGIKLYSSCIDYLQQSASFRSVISNSILESANGSYGDEYVPKSLRGRIIPGELFLWPLMSELFAFDPNAIVERSLYCTAIAQCQTVGQCYQVLQEIRSQLEAEGKLRAEERLPLVSSYSL
jgi:hypothetical protein